MLTYYRKFILYSKYLYLYSSTIKVKDNLYTKVYPNSYNKSKKATLSKAKANKRFLKEVTLAKIAYKTFIPTKKVS